MAAANDNTRIPRRKQKAVYWVAQPKDSDGRTTYAAPVEIDCRWSDVTEELVGPSGAAVTIKSKVYPDRDLEKDSVLWLGGLNDLTDFTNPFKNPAAARIQGWTKIPDARAKRFLRIAFL
jgi:hypothetical protein